jgi:hypothetical protein
MDGADAVAFHAVDGNFVYTINNDGNLLDGYGGVFTKK